MRGVVMLPTDVKVSTGCPAALEVVLSISKTTNKCTDSNVHSPSHADFISVFLEVAAILCPVVENTKFNGTHVLRMQSERDVRKNSHSCRNRDVAIRVVRFILVCAPTDHRPDAAFDTVR